MYRFFLKLYIGIFFASFLGFITILGLTFFTVVLPYEWQDFHEDTDLELQIINIQLTQQAPKTLHPFLQQYHSTFEFNVTASPFSELPAIAQAQFANHETTDFFDKKAAKWTRYHYLPQYQQFIKIAEIDDFRVSDHLLSILVVLALPTLLVIIALTITMIIMVKRIASPLLRLETISQQFGAGDLSIRMDTDCNDPIHSLASTFNQMANRIEGSFQQQQIIIGALPHELRTPLHRIRFALDLTRNQQDLEKLRQRIEQIDTYTGELEQAIQDVLEFSRLQSQAITTNKQPVPLYELLQQITVDHAIPANITCSHELTVMGNQRLLYRALLNLLSNAQRHKKQTIAIQVEQHKQAIQICIDDDGEGILSQYQEQVFTPFFRIDQSRNQKTGGIGLGLTLVKLIIEKHAGHIVATTNSMGGARLKITLPI